MRHVRQILLFLLISFSVRTTPSAAESERDFYVRFETGGSFSRYLEMVDGDVGSAALFEGSLGYQFHNRLRSWFSLGSREEYKASGIESGIIVNSNISNITSMANIALELGQLGIWTPYVSGGVGISWNQSEISAQSIDGPKVLLPSRISASFAWQASTGIWVAITPQWGLDVGYRYFDSGTVRTVSTENGGVHGKLRAHELWIGISYYL